MKRESLIYKAKPIQGHIPTNDGDWLLSKYQHTPAGINNEMLSAKYGDREVLLVKFVFPDRDKKDGLLEGDGEHKGSLSNKKDWFFIDVPKYFFSYDSTTEKLGEFTATPEYTHKDVLHIKWTGWGRHSGWIDLNVQHRGAGGGTSSAPGEVACAKWS